MSFIVNVFKAASKSEQRDMRRHLAEENRKFGPKLQLIDEKPMSCGTSCRVRVWRSKDFLVQEFKQDGAKIRLTVNRTAIDRNGDYLDGISWDDLFRLKNECGYGAFTAVEVFPPEKALVNDANMRHLMVLDENPPYAWIVK